MITLSDTGSKFKDLLVSRGRQLVRGGRIRKCGGDVISYSPQIAELLGSASRAILGATAVVSGAAMVPSAMAAPVPPILLVEPSNEPVNVVLNSGDDITLDGPLAISVFAQGHGNISVTNDGEIIVASTASPGGAVAVAAISQGGGNITLTNNGNLLAEQGGLAAAQSAGASGDITLINRGEALTTSPDSSVMSALHYGGGDGNILIQNQGTITGDNAIIAFHDRVGNITVENSAEASLLSRNHAIKLDHYYTGAISVTNGGTLTSTDATGILIQRYQTSIDPVLSSDGAININLLANSLIDAQTYGVRAIHAGAGDILVTIDANARVLAGTVDDCLSAISIERLTYGVEGDINLTTTAGSLIEAGSAGIYIVNQAAGDVTLNLAGNIVTGGAPVDDARYRYGTWGNGVYVTHKSEGVLDLTLSGSINSSNIGLALYRGAMDDMVDITDRDLLVELTSTASIISGSHGIEAFSYRDGDIVIDVAGSVDSAANGVNAIHGANGALDIDNSGTISAAKTAISASHYGTGALNITNTGTITQGADVMPATIMLMEMPRDGAISVTRTESGDIDITNAAGGIIRASEFAIRASYLQQDPPAAPEGNINLTNNGEIYGAMNFQTNAVNGSVLTHNGLWDSQGLINNLAAGDNDVTINGVWNAQDSLTYFDDNAVGSTQNDRLTIGVRGTLNAGGNGELPNRMVGVDQTSVYGTLSMNNGLANDRVEIGGDVTFYSSSVLHGNVGPDGDADYLAVGGMLDLQGGTLKITYVGEDAPFIGQGFIIAHASDGITGRFDYDYALHTAFLGWDIAYEDNRIYADYLQVRALRQAAQSRNQVAVANAIDDLGGVDSNDLKREAANLTSDAEARQAFDLLSGELHASARTALMDDSRLTRNAVLDRLNGPEGGAIWGQTFFNSGNSDTDSKQGLAKLNRESWGFMAGGDVALGSNAMVGVAASYTSSDLTQNARAASGKTEAIQALAYVGAQAGAANFKAGVGYSWADVDTSRTATIGAISNKLVADYDANLFQAFAEASLRLDRKSVV